MNYEVDQDVPLATSLANQIKEADYCIHVNPLPGQNGD
jgi:hypothetical protein